MPTPRRQSSSRSNRSAATRILLTAFEPFGGSTVNPSQQVLERVVARREELRGVELHARVLAVEAKRGPAAMRGAIARVKPDAIIALGESSRARAITLERVYVNLADYRIPDNAGARWRNRPIARRGPAAYFSTLPIEAIQRALAAQKIPCEPSLSAGAFLCNHVAYVALHRLAEHGRGKPSTRASAPTTPAGFVHLPRLPEQVRATPGAASMPLEIQVEAAMTIIRVVAKSAAAQPRRARAGHR